ncbi:hypothetical protein F4776DRAFT_256713 [Hypoxylon sp. NC0597]|nr:hypothetical protein F4776DRAFT_256713 [Hypoxylon sp. NC0597]
MCIQYPHHSLCQNPHCETIIGRRHRNRYCNEARQARRLGHCRDGLRIEEPIRSREQTVRCARCKRLQQNQGGCKGESKGQDRGPDPGRGSDPGSILKSNGMSPVTRSKSVAVQGSLGPAVKNGADLFDHVFANPLAVAEAELKEEEAAREGKKKAVGSSSAAAAATEAPAPEEDEREVFVVRTPEEEARASTRGRGRARGRPRGSGRGRGSSRNTASQAQAHKGTQGARDIPADERLPYGFPAEGETNRPLAPVEDLYIWEEDIDD